MGSSLLIIVADKNDEKQQFIQAKASRYYMISLEGRYSERAERVKFSTLRRIKGVDGISAWITIEDLESLSQGETRRGCERNLKRLMPSHVGGNGLLKIDTKIKKDFNKRRKAEQSSSQDHTFGSWKRLRTGLS